MALRINLTETMMMKIIIYKNQYYLEIDSKSGSQRGIPFLSLCIPVEQPMSLKAQ
jgi:hypothetical protein